MREANMDTGEIIVKHLTEDEFRSGKEKWQQLLNQSNANNLVTIQHHHWTGSTVPRHKAPLALRLR